MLDLDKCFRCFKVSQSFCKDFAEIAKRISQKQGFAKEVEEAENNYDTVQGGKIIEWPNEAGFDLVKISGSRTERALWFISAAGFKAEFKIPAKRLGIKLSSWFDENGHEIKGVFIQPNAAQCPDTCLRVVLYHEKRWSKKNRRVQPKKRLRLKEADDAFDHQTASVIRKHRPKDLIFACSLSLQWLVGPTP